MSGLIVPSDIIDVFEMMHDKSGSVMWEQAIQIAKDIRKVDAVPVVRCKDCKYGHELCESIICLYHNADGNYCEDGGFCAWGERRTDGND